MACNRSAQTAPRIPCRSQAKCLAAKKYFAACRTGDDLSIPVHQELKLGQTIVRAGLPAWIVGDRPHDSDPVLLLAVHQHVGIRVALSTRCLDGSSARCFSDWCTTATTTMLSSGVEAGVVSTLVMTWSVSGSQVSARWTL